MNTLSPASEKMPLKKGNTSVGGGTGPTRGYVRGKGIGGLSRRGGGKLRGSDK